MYACACCTMQQPCECSLQPASLLSAQTLQHNSMHCSKTHALQYTSCFRRACPSRSRIHNSFQHSCELLPGSLPRPRSRVRRSVCSPSAACAHLCMTLMRAVAEVSTAPQRATWQPADSSRGSRRGSSSCCGLPPPRADICDCSTAAAQETTVLPGPEGTSARAWVGELECCECEAAAPPTGCCCGCALSYMFSAIYTRSCTGCDCGVVMGRPSG